jgi:hypothetical protein
MEDEVVLEAEGPYIIMLCLVGQSDVKTTEPANSEDPQGRLAIEHERIFQAPISCGQFAHGSQSLLFVTVIVTPSQPQASAHIGNP